MISGLCCGVTNTRNWANWFLLLTQAKTQNKNPILQIVWNNSEVSQLKWHYMMTNNGNHYVYSKSLYTIYYFVPDLLSWDKSYSLPEAWGFLQISTSTLKRSESSETFQDHFEDCRCRQVKRELYSKDNLSDVFNNSRSWLGLMNAIFIFCMFNVAKY